MYITDVPRSLIYKNIEINEILGSAQNKTLERVFYERLTDLPFVENSSNAPTLVRIIFNNARYIYYLLICEEDEPSLYFNIYLAKAAEGIDSIEQKGHIMAATMALLYNWLSHKLNKNRVKIPGLPEEMHVHFSESLEEDIIKLKEKIYNYFTVDKNTTLSDVKKDFITLLIDDFDLLIGVNEEEFDVPYVDEFANKSYPIQDVAEGIDFIIEDLNIFIDKKLERIGFLEKIMNRLENERSLVSNKDILEDAKQKIEFEKQRLLLEPEEDSSSFVSLENFRKVTDSRDGDISKILADNENSLEDLLSQEIERQPEGEWDNRYDGFLKDNLNAQKIFNALREISSPNLPKTQRPFWWVFFTVITEIRWAKEQRGNQKLVLQWANHHFKLGWDWNKNSLFKFSDISQQIRKLPSSKWNEKTMVTSIGLYYGELAKQMKDAFVEEVNGGRLMDRKNFIKKDYQRINNGH